MNDNMFTFFSTSRSTHIHRVSGECGRQPCSAVDTDICSYLTVVDM